MSKIIIDNQADTSDRIAINLVLAVMSNGKISETAGVKHYCHHCQFEDIHIACTPNKKSVRFVLYDGEKS